MAESSRNWEGRSVSDDIESVRSLNDWSPTSSRSYPPPTSRLLLNLDGVGSGPVMKPGAKAASKQNMRIIEETNQSKTKSKPSVDNAIQSPLIVESTPKLTFVNSNKSLKTAKSSKRSNPNTNRKKKLSKPARRVPAYLLDKLQAKSSQIRKVFRTMDRDKDGRVEPRELQHAMAEWGIQISDLDIQNIVRAVDTDNSGYIQFNEFCDAFFPTKNGEGGIQQLAGEEKVRGKAKPKNLLPTKSCTEIFGNVETLDHESQKKLLEAQREERRREQKEMLKTVPNFVKDKIQAKAANVSKVFLHMDEDKNGMLSAREFQRGMAEMGIVLSDKDLVSIMRVVDQDKSGGVTLQEFSNAFLGGKDYTGFLENAKHHEERHIRVHKDPSNPDDVIVKEVKRSELLEPVEKEELGIQMKVLNPMLAKCTNGNAFARKMLQLYRSCEPDEFGFISKKKFTDVLKKKYAVKETQGEKLFSLGVNNKSETDEMNYHQFRKALTRVDGDITELYPPVVPRPKIRINEKMAKATTKIGTRPKNFTQMSHTERDEFRQRNRILRLIEEHKTELRNRFFERRQFGKYNTNIKTRISFEKLTEVINDLGVDSSLETVRKLYAQGDETHRNASETSRKKDSITFSQLCRRTADYFARLDAGEDYRQATKKELNTQLKGRLLGCRAQGTGAASKNQSSEHPSEFWTHHDLPQRKHTVTKLRRKENSKKHAGNRTPNNQGIQPEHWERHGEVLSTSRTNQSDSSSICSTSRSYASSYLPEITSRSYISTSRLEEDEALDTTRRKQIEREHLWRSRWTEKTFKKERKGGFGGNRRANGPLSKKMYEGNGNIIAIAEEPLPSCRLAPLSTGRSYVSTSPFAVEDTRYF